MKKDSDLHYCCNKNSPLQQLRRDSTDIHPGAVVSGAAWGGFHQHQWCKPVSQPFLTGYIKQLIKVIMSIYLQLLPLSPFKLKCRYNWQWGSSASNMSGEFSSLSSLVLHESSKRFHTSSITLAFCQHPVYLKTWEDNHLWFKKLGVEELLSQHQDFLSISHKFQGLIIWTLDITVMRIEILVGPLLFFLFLFFCLKIGSIVT